MRTLGIVLIGLALLVAGAGAASAQEQPSQWQMVYDRAAPNTTAIAMFDSQFGLAIIGGGIERTTDGGGTWREMLSSGNLAGPIAFADRQHAWIAGRGGTMWRTADGGLTWRVQDTHDTAPITSIAPVSADEAWMTTFDPGSGMGFAPHRDSALLHTVDGGTTWQRVAVQGYGMFIGAWFAGRDGWLLATQCHPGDPLAVPDAEPGEPGHPPCNDVRTLLHTTDDGASWSALATAPAFVPDWITLVDAAHAYTFTRDQDLYATSDGGRTWQLRGRLGFELGVRDMRFVSVTEGWASGTRCGSASCAFEPALARTIDGGRSWTYVDAPPDAGLTFDAAGTTAVLSNDQTGISTYDTANGTWQTAATDAGPQLANIWFDTRDIGYALTFQREPWTSGDGGQTWARGNATPGAVATPTPGQPPAWLGSDPRASRLRVAIDATHGWRVEWPGHAVVVSSTSDAGATWHDELTVDTDTLQAPQLVAADGRIWLLIDATYSGGGSDIPSLSPLRTVIYRRDIPAGIAATPAPAGVHLPDTGRGAPAGASGWTSELSFAAAIAVALVSVVAGAHLRRRARE